MSRSSALFAVIALCTLTSACHGRFKRHAHTLDAVNTSVIVTGGPTVDVPTSTTGMAGVAVLDTVANVGMAVGAAATAGKIRSAVDIGQMSGVMEASIEDGMADPPFSFTTGDPSGALMEVRLNDFGVNASTGIPDFQFNGVVKIYRAQDGWRVYRNRFRCSSQSGGWNMGGMVGIGQSAGSLVQLAEMSDSEIRQTFDQQARACGQSVVSEMRRHAGRR